MTRPDCLISTLRLTLGWIAAACLAAGPSRAGDDNTPTNPDRQAYEAACTFLVDEIARLDAIVAQGAGRDKLLRENREFGLRVYRRHGDGTRIDYVVTSTGKTMISQAVLGPRYFGMRLSAASLKDSLRLAQDLPPTLQTGCDRLYLTVKTNRARITGIVIDVDID